MVLYYFLFSLIMKYENPPEFNEIILLELNSNDERVVIRSILSCVLTGGDYELAVSVVRRFCKHEREWIRGTAITSISHIARLWKKLPNDLKEVVHVARADPSEVVRNKSEFVIDDLEVFIKGYHR